MCAEEREGGKVGRSPSPREGKMWTLWNWVRALGHSIWDPHYGWPLGKLLESLLPFRRNHRLSSLRTILTMASVFFSAAVFHKTVKSSSDKSSLSRRRPAEMNENIAKLTKQYQERLAVVVGNISNAFCNQIGLFLEDFMKIVQTSLMPLRIVKMKAFLMISIAYIDVWYSICTFTRS